MNNLVIPIPDETFVKLQEIAKSYQITPEEFVSVTIKDMLEQPEDDFQRVVKYVLKKNTELYRRLA